MKVQNKSLRSIARGNVDAHIDEAATADTHRNLAAISADNTDEERSHSPIVTSECVAYYHTEVIRNLSQTRERVDSVVYDVPFNN